ncbi:GTPase HflX [Spirochaetota bacterium]
MDASVNRIPSSRDERSLLLAIRIKGHDIQQTQYSLDELKMLVQTAGGIVVDSMIINREKIDPGFIMGKGNLARIGAIINEEKIKLLVFDLNSISPAQVRKLEDNLKCRVVGRNEVIIDIFARRARSSDAKIQVELAQLKYLLPRLKGLGGVLSRLGGGIGTRGPGEKMLETDRRHILKRITKLKKKLKKIEAHRERLRNARNKESLGAVVGYTNTGKSTLINLLAKDDLFVENRLFATLDSYTRIVYLENTVKTLLTDTVGFITNLPANLIESFRSTLEEIKNADYIIHVIDLYSDNFLNNIETVNAELNNIMCNEKPMILFFNKSDIAGDEKVINRMKAKYPLSVVGSAKTGEGIDELKKRISEIIKKGDI